MEITASNYPSPSLPPRIKFVFVCVALVFGDRNQKYDQLDCRFPVIFFPIRTTAPVNLKHL